MPHSVNQSLMTTYNKLPEMPHTVNTSIDYETINHNSQSAKHKPHTTKNKKRRNLTSILKAELTYLPPALTLLSNC
jgi:hypothetical protein